MEYELVIGLEIHVQLNTASKAFCADPLSFGVAPNTMISPLTLALPGTLPRANTAHRNKAVWLGWALHGEVMMESRFDRKHYFYPDLPKGYQITQDVQPVIVGGHMMVQGEQSPTKIRIHHIHMEEDAGKSIHDLSETASMVDLNRAGKPLLEIVTEPDFRSAAEVDDFLHQMQHLVRWLDVSDGNMEEGSLRCDCNISVRPMGQTKYGERCEIKNMNSFRFIRQAIRYEFERQTRILELGGQVSQQTLQFDTVTGQTSPMRSKESAMDYRYFPEPDLPPLQWTAEALHALRGQMPELPETARKRLVALGLSASEAFQLTADPQILAFFEALHAQSKLPKSAAGLLINRLIPLAESRQQSLAELQITPIQWAVLLQHIEAGEIAFSAALQHLVPLAIESLRHDWSAMAKAQGLLLSRDADYLDQAIASVLADFPDKVATYKKGQKGLLGFFMGELMRRANPKPSPQAASQKLEEALKG